MTWKPIWRASYTVNVGGADTTLWWNEEALNRLNLWFDDADALLTPVWEWQRTSSHVDISPSRRAATVRIVSDASTSADIQQLTALCNTAIANKTPGVFGIVMGNSPGYTSELRCYMVPGAVTDWYFKEGFMRQEFDIVPVDEYWYRSLGNPHINAGAYGQITVTSPLGLDFDVTWASPAGTDPKITVTPQSGSTSSFTNVYGVDATASGKVFISTRDRAVTIDGANGYDKRIDGAMGSGSYIFEALPVGIHKVTNNGTSACDITTYKRLAAPEWAE